MKEKNMVNKTPISNAESYQELGEFWGEHDATETGEEGDADFEVSIQSQRRYYPVDSQLSCRLKEEAKAHGISEETLLNLWLQEKISLIEENKSLAKK